jgi:hypothetical protein
MSDTLIYAQDMLSVCVQRTGGLDRATSEFVSARLRSGWCAKRTQGCILVRARTALRLVDSATACVALHRSARSRGYKLSREGTDPRPLRGICV